MKNILLIGAGKSSGALIDYLLKHAEQDNYQLTVADITKEGAEAKTKNRSHSIAIALDVNNETYRQKHISAADIVVSMLPAHMHFSVAKDCVRLKKHLLTASYVSPELAALHNDAVKNEILLLNEIGLDPGIDHMSAMKVIHHIQEIGGELTSFKSFCGGLVAPESNDNPWGYKFSWNPRNVILAGQSTAQYLEQGEYKYLPYHRLFANSETIQIEGYGKFDAYANRDSLSYRKIYGIELVKTMLRGTLRQHHFCSAWNVFVQLGLTDDSYQIDVPKNYTWENFISSFLPATGNSIMERLLYFTKLSQDDEIIKMIVSTGVMSKAPIGLLKGSPAEILQHILEEKWRLNPEDKDMIVMQHQFEYTHQNKTKLITSELICKGENSNKTAMSKTVGLPLAMAVRGLVKGKIKLTGVHIPVLPELYLPILEELKQYDIEFTEKEIELTN